MERHDIVESREDVIQNIKTLYSYLKDKDNEENYKWALARIKNGKWYVVEIVNSHVCFSPSRFVGYKNNTKELHTENHGDGQQTNEVLEKFYKSVEDERLDTIFQQELSKYNLSSERKKYWIPKEMSIEDILSFTEIYKIKYWIGRVSYDYYWQKAVDNKMWIGQYRYGIQDSRTVSNILNCITEIKEHDIIFLTKGDRICAYGNVTKHPYRSSQVSNLNEVIQNNKHDYYDDIVTFEDNNIFFEDLRDGCEGWGQRIMVDKWNYFLNDSQVSTRNKKIKSAIIKGNVQMSLFGITEEFAEEIKTELKKQYEKKYMFIEKTAKLLREKKNIILQGAPGTGKTYNTAALALAVLGINNIDFNDHKKVMKLYDSLQERQIFFTTFHQSLDYEDFVEGLKPRIQSDDNGNYVGVTYEPEDGIFKRACEAVKNDESKDIVECIEDYKQSIKGFENRKEIPTITGKSSLYVWWKEGNTTISTRSSNSTSTRSADYTPSPMNIEKIKLQAQGKGVENNWQQYAQAFIEAVKKEYHIHKNKPVVLIIDEINRGNVSKIFGELITLLEADKREHGKHPIKVQLPYSKTIFDIPSDLYIIGTMNTTDRSTGTLDYALRRRFAFITLRSDETVIIKHYDKEGTQELKNIAVNLFRNIRDFIQHPKHQSGEFDIDDLMVGHSYFMAKDKEDLEFKIEFEVIPLIKEYINDGILIVSDEEKNLIFNSWIKLETVSFNESEEESIDDYE